MIKMKKLKLPRGLRRKKIDSDEVN